MRLFEWFEQARRKQITKRALDMVAAMHNAQENGWSVGYLDLRQSPKIYDSVKDIPEWTSIRDVMQIMYLREQPSQAPPAKPDLAGEETEWK